ncbi:hypothetical protein HPB51_017656 [Rhipicephalus microplus]|uniref:CCHC-type domain-containing protein n=1 Tax=Rhipicephalus microplus TaxID=6941 RepID=A0A9J6E2R4_RHIMP|nr:hypothetical protein HPB51_017656 [Rhipicephalus microplus]
MYSKNAILSKAPYRLAEEERISLILSGIEDDKWANPLAAQLCGTVTELIDRAALLDARRRTTVCAENDKKPSSSTASRGQGSNQRVPASSSANLPKANPRSDFSGAPHPRPISARSCFNCGDIGHLSRDCRKPKTPATIRADEKRAKRDNSSHETGTTSPRQANCFLHSTGGTLPIVSGTANNRPVRVCIDSGANLFIISANALTDDIPTHAWRGRTSRDSSRDRRATHRRASRDASGVGRIRSSSCTESSFLIHELQEESSQMPLTMRPQPSCTKTWSDEIPNTLYSQPDEWRRCTPFSSPSTPTRRHIPINAWESFTAALHTAEFRMPVLSGHRHDVCASPKATLCSRCGIELPLQEPPSTPKCILCEGSHLTGTGSCEGRNLHQPCEQMKQPQTQLQEPVPRGDNAPQVSPRAHSAEKTQASLDRPA